MVDILGGKGAHLAEMSRLGFPVPAGFTISTEACSSFYLNGMQLSKSLKSEILEYLSRVEESMGMKYGGLENPLLLSCRSGAKMSMPGMMDSILNVGLCSSTIPGLIRRTGGNERFVYDSYRRLIMMYADSNPSTEAKSSVSMRAAMDHAAFSFRQVRNCKSERELSISDLVQLCAELKCVFKNHSGCDFPDDPYEQLFGSVSAVFRSWHSQKACSFRKIEGIPEDSGTAVTVQSMVFGNMGENSATGVAFTRDPSSGQNCFYGEWLSDAQGEDLVFGIRIPDPLCAVGRRKHAELHSLQAAMPQVYAELLDISHRLELHYKDMLDVEFTVQEGRLYILQCRVGKRTSQAALKIAMDMLKEGLISEQEALGRVSPEQLENLLYPLLDPESEKNAVFITAGIPAGPGGASGRIVFSSEDALAFAERGEKCIFVLNEVKPDDIVGMRAASGILAAAGGKTSHAALVCRSWGKSCIVGAGDISVDKTAALMRAGGRIFKEGDILSLNGSSGAVYSGAVSLIEGAEGNVFKRFFKMVDKHRNSEVLGEVSSVTEASIALKYGADGVFLFNSGLIASTGLEEIAAHLKQSSESDLRSESAQTLSDKLKSSFIELGLFLDGKTFVSVLCEPSQSSFGEPFPAASRQEPCDVCKRESPEDVLCSRSSYLALCELQMKAFFDAARIVRESGVHVSSSCLLVSSVSEQSIIRDLSLIFQRLQGEMQQCEKSIRNRYHFGVICDCPGSVLSIKDMLAFSELVFFDVEALSRLCSGILSGNAYDDFRPGGYESAEFLISYGVNQIRHVKPEIAIGSCFDSPMRTVLLNFCSRAKTHLACKPADIPLARLISAQVTVGSLRERGNF